MISLLKELVELIKAIVTLDPETKKKIEEFKERILGFINTKPGKATIAIVLAIFGFFILLAVLPQPAFVLLRGFVIFVMAALGGVIFWLVWNFSKKFAFGLVALSGWI